MRLDRNQEITRLRARLSLAERSIKELKADRNEVVEECAQMIDEAKFEAERDGWSPEDYAAAIRTLKDKP